MEAFEVFKLVETPTDGSIPDSGTQLDLPMIKVVYIDND